MKFTPITQIHNSTPIHRFPKNYFQNVLQLLFGFFSDEKWQLNISVWRCNKDGDWWILKNENRSDEFFWLDCLLRVTALFTHSVWPKLQPTISSSRNMPSELIGPVYNWVTQSQLSINWNLCPQARESPHNLLRFIRNELVASPSLLWIGERKLKRRTVTYKGLGVKLMDYFFQIPVHVMCAHLTRPTMERIQGRRIFLKTRHRQTKVPKMVRKKFATHASA